MFAAKDEIRERHARIVQACAEAGREPLVFSIMTGCIIGADEADVRDRAARLKEASRADGDLDAWLDGLRDAWIIGTVEQVMAHLAELEDIGVQRVMLQHQLHEELDAIALMGELVD